MNLSNAPRFSQILTTMRQPQWIAALLSLGFHVVLFAAGPSFSSLNASALGEGNPDSQERRVPLIELTPEEQNRLPDFSAPAYSLDSSDDLFGLFPPSGNSIPLEPGSDFGASLAIPTPRLPVNPFPGSISPYTSPRRSTITLSPRRSPFSPTPGGNPSGRNPEGPAAGAATSPDNPTPAPNSSQPSAEAGATDLGDPRQANGPDADANSTPLDPTDPSAPEQQGAESASELLARVEFSAAQTSVNDVEIAKAAWQQAIREKLGDTVAEAPDPLVLQVPYSGRLCLSPEPSDGLLGVVGLPNEESDGLELWTTVLKSTGYPFLNQAAEQALQNLQQQNTDDSALEANTQYQVVVKINYDSQSCITREALLQSRTTEAENPDTPLGE